MEVNSLHAGNPIEETNPRTMKHRSTFDRSDTQFSTMRFGEITPHFVDNARENDNWEVNSAHNLATFTLKAPLMQDINIKKDYFAVPIQAILPMQYERFRTQPNIGDDIPADAYTNVENFWYKIWQYFSAWKTTIVTEVAALDTDDADYKDDVLEIIGHVMSYLTQSEYFYSDGALMNYLGICTANKLVIHGKTDSNVDPAKTIDNIIDEFYQAIKADFTMLEVEDSDGAAYTIGVDENQGALAMGKFYTIRTWIEWMRDNGYSYDVVDCEGTINKIADFLEEYFTEDASWSYKLQQGTLPEYEDIDLARLFAYQIVCAHFYTNDTVDYIYSAELYRQNLFNAVQGPFGFDSLDPNFNWNGINLQYDYCSAYFFDQIIKEGTDNGLTKEFGKYASLIFAFRHSLRYVDYFTGAKTRPLAMGDTTVYASTSGGNTYVSIVDTIQKKWYARFLQSVQATGRKIANYVKEQTGAVMAHDYHDPEYLAHTADKAYGNETQNTGDAQVTEANSITTRLQSNASRYAFNFNCDRQTILIGVTYFDIQRIYPKATDRLVYIKDRNDWFNEMLEFIGDQPIYGEELGLNYGTFGYTQRYKEFKQKISRAVGGFVRNLPGYVFLADNTPGTKPSNISPSYIRSSNEEIDPFYLSLTGYSLGTYWHFMVKTVNNVKATRNMSHNAQLW